MRPRCSIYVPEAGRMASSSGCAGDRARQGGLPGSWTGVCPAAAPSHGACPLWFLCVTITTQTSVRRRVLCQAWALDLSNPSLGAISCRIAYCFDRPDLPDDAPEAEAANSEPKAAARHGDSLLQCPDRAPSSNRRVRSRADGGR